MRSNSIYPPLRGGKLRVGLIGAGGMGLGEHLPAWRALPFAEVVAVADMAESARARALAAGVPRAWSDWREMLETADLDALDICTPNAEHAPAALAGLACGLHVLCEKPLATTLIEVQKLCEAAQNAQRVLMTAHHLRFQPLALQLKALVDEGLLGQVYYARAQWLRRRMLPARSTFTVRAISGGGAALDIGVHVLDLACWLMGHPKPVSVSAQSGKFLADRPDLAGPWGDWDRATFDVEDFAAGFVRFENGATLTLESSWLGFQPEPETKHVQIYGQRGGLTWPAGIFCGERDRVPWTMKLEADESGKSYSIEVRAFAEACRDGKPSPVPPEQSLGLLAIIEGMYRSAALGREVSLV